MKASSQFGEKYIIMLKSWKMCWDILLCISYVYIGVKLARDI